MLDYAHPRGDGTLALHLADSGTSLVSDGVRLYLEIWKLDDFCRKLQAKGFFITQMPRLMPWGWRHAYLHCWRVTSNSELIMG
jgi:hypothetical protein